jgi:hypothetical protein
MILRHASGANNRSISLPSWCAGMYSPARPRLARRNRIASSKLVSALAGRSTSTSSTPNSAGREERQNRSTSGR